jgi:CelD/BcsL family acetyltransferase involved in cellulose biosynthesis
MSDTAALDQRHAAGAPPAQQPDNAPDGITFAVYSRLDDVEAEWRQFEQNADCTAFQTFDWLSLWCEYVGWRSGTEPAIVVGRSESRTLFILPLAVNPGRIRRLSWIGSDLCDYNAPLLAPDFAARITHHQFTAMWSEILTRLQGEPQHRHDLVELTKMAATVGRQPNPFLALPVALNPCNAYVADLFGEWDAFYQAKRSSATRRRDRTKLKRLGELGAIRFVTVEGGVEAKRTIDALVDQKTRSFARMGAPNIFEYPGWREFYSAVASSPRTQHMVHVSRLDTGETFAGINLGLIHGDSYYHVLVSHDDGEAARFGPGVAHLRELMRYAIERGLKKFDFTIGDERYKREWADHQVPLYDHVAAATARGYAALPLVIAHRRIKRLIKQNETFWSLFSRARASMGGRAVGGSSEHASPPLAPK